MVAGQALDLHAERARFREELERIHHQRPVRHSAWPRAGKASIAANEVTSRQLPFTRRPGLALSDY
jgi:hypothetical protein